MPHDLLTVDHFIPRAAGGTNRAENKVISCWLCNNRKGANPGWQVKYSRYGDDIAKTGTKINPDTYLYAGKIYSKADDKADA